jgi:chromosome segregation ATPase
VVAAGIGTELHKCRSNLAALREQRDNCRRHLGSLKVQAEAIEEKVEATERLLRQTEESILNNLCAIDRLHDISDDGV